MFAHSRVGKTGSGPAKDGIGDDLAILPEREAFSIPEDVKLVVSIA